MCALRGHVGMLQCRPYGGRGGHLVTTCAPRRPARAGGREGWVAREGVVETPHWAQWGTLGGLCLQVVLLGPSAPGPPRLEGVRLRFSRFLSWMLVWAASGAGFTLRPQVCRECLARALSPYFWWKPS